MPAIGLGTLPAWYLPDYKPELANQAVRTALLQGSKYLSVAQRARM